MQGPKTYKNKKAYSKHSVTKYLSIFCPNAGKYGKNADQNNSEYGHFLRSGGFEMIRIFLKVTGCGAIFSLQWC